MDENIFVAPKMQNKYGAIHLFIIPIWPYSNIGLFSIAPCKVITLIFWLYFWYQFGILYFSFSSYSVTYCYRQLNRKQYRNEGPMRFRLFPENGFLSLQPFFT